MKNSTNRQKSAGTNSKKSGVKWLLRTLTVVGVCVAYYFIFSLFFDTPLESELKKSNHKLEEQYKILSERHDSIYSILDNLVKRDIEIHKILFESDLYLSWRDSISLESNRTNLELEKRSNAELGDEFIARTGQLYQQIYALDAKLRSQLRYAYENLTSVNKIPAIQPIYNPDFSLLAASFGQRINPFTKIMTAHNGVDFSIPIGTAVFATADGVVTEIQSYGRVTGVSMKVKHGDTYDTFYANLGRVLAQVGERVNRGEVIAFSGDTGMSFAPHLHYEVRYRGKPVNPINYFFFEVNTNNQDELVREAASGMQSFD